MEQNRQYRNKPTDTQTLMYNKGDTMGRGRIAEEREASG